jgi:hypothetical protein
MEGSVRPQSNIRQFPDRFRRITNMINVRLFLHVERDARHENAYLPFTAGLFLPLWHCQVSYMPKTKKDFAWEITRIRGNSSVHVGIVQVPDEKTALETAIELFKITSPDQQKRLVARRWN